MLPKFEVRRSRVLRKIREGGVAVSVCIGSHDPATTEVLASCGFDAIWLCQEHGSVDYRSLADQIRAAKLYDADVVVRCPRGSYSDYIRFLDMDAAGLMIPHVMSLQDAKELVDQTKFPPIGNRACDSGNMDGHYARVPYLEYLKDCNQERFNIFQIEDPEPLDEIEAIANLEGADMLFFGPRDYATRMGMPDKIWSPETDEIRIKVAQAARKAGKMAGTVGNPQLLPKLVDMGFNYINLGSDVGALFQFAEQAITAVQDLS